jgi:sensor c-di-GMP phosphodiesterase-like protein
VVAEGVESTTDLQALQAMDCEYGQGVAIAPPMPLLSLLELLQHRPERPAAAGEEPGSAQATRSLGINRVA